MKNQNEKPKILHIDDNKDFLDMFSLTFKKWFNVTSVQSCSEAFKLMESESYDTVVTDYEMPMMTGLECLKKIKEKGYDIPVIFYTGQGNEEVAREAFIQGASDYFTKTLKGFALTEKIVNSIHKAIEMKNERKERRETEEKYRTLVDLSPDPIVILQDNIFKFANSAFTNLFGYTEEEIKKGISFFDLVEKKDVATVGKILEVRLSGKNIFQKYIINLKNKSQELINCEISNTTINYLGKPALLKIIRDVTEQKRDRERAEWYREQLFILGTNGYFFNKNEEENIPGLVDGESGKKYLVNGKYTIKDLVDINYLKKIMESFSTATGFTTGFVSYPDQEVLFGTGWREICTKFHRANPNSVKCCKKSNEYMSRGLKELKEFSIYKCENGLVDGCTPVIIKGTHIAYLATGQALFEKPDREKFKKQAERFGYDTDAYMKALDRVPIVTVKQFKAILTFLSEMATLIAELGLSNLTARENARVLAGEIAEGKFKEKELRESEKRYRLLLEKINDGLGMVNSSGYWTFVNPRFAGMLGYTQNEMHGRSMFEFLDNRNRVILEKQFLLRKKGSVEIYEIDWTAKDGTKVRTVNSPQPIIGDNGEFKGSFAVIVEISDYKRRSETSLLYPKNSLKVQ